MADIFIKVTEDDFIIDDEVTALKQATVGAIAVFIGTVRDISGELISLTLEHYPQMTEQQLGVIAAQAASQFDLNGLRIIHRVGRLAPTENIVLVAAASAHREAALKATHLVMDYLKTDAPFWKAEETKEGQSWVSARTDDDLAKDKWR